LREKYTWTGNGQSESTSGRIVVAEFIAAAALLAESLFPGVGCRVEAQPYRITGYVRGHHSPWTADGTSVWTREKVVAASWNLPFGTMVRVEGLDYAYRVADRGGGLEGRHIDVLVDSVAIAYKLEEWVGGRYARVCVYR
jgi:3D (Asp-Asp-Asp) domain-containing protein